VRLLVSCGIVNIILRLLQDSRIDNLWLSRDSFWVRILRVRAHVHIVVVSPLLLQRWPSFLTDQRIVILVLRILLKEGLRCRTLALIMVGAHVTADVLALIEIAVVNVLFHTRLAHVRSRAHHDANSAGLIGIVEDICVSNVLSMNGSASFDHG
jgi:hypothetical protein